MESFARFEILRPLATGGMSQLELARDTRDAGRLVVIKRLRPELSEDPELIASFETEIEVARRLAHPNVVATIAAGHDDHGGWFLAMEYLVGAPVIDLLRAAGRGGVVLPLGACVRILVDAARGLAYVHGLTDASGESLGLVHRDVSPHNLYACADGVTKVLDFGIAKATVQRHHTTKGTIKGKLSYLAPEQLKGDTVDGRADVWALGVVAHELIARRPLFRGATDAETVAHLLGREVPSLATVRPDCPPGVAAAVASALVRDPARRTSAAALAAALEAAAQDANIDASPARVGATLLALCPDHTRSDGAHEPRTRATDETDSGRSSRSAIMVGAITAPGLVAHGSRRRWTRVAAGVATLVAGAGALWALRPARTADPRRSVAAAKGAPVRARADVAPSEAPVPGYGRPESIAAPPVAALPAGAPSVAMPSVAAPSVAAPSVAAPPVAAPSVAAPSVAAPSVAAPPVAAPAASAPPPSTAEVQPTAAGVAPSPTAAATPGPPDDVAQPAGVGTVRLVGMPPDSMLAVDGQPELLGLDQELHLAPGRHRLTISGGPLARPRSFAVAVRAGETISRTITLDRSSRLYGRFSTD